MKTIEGKIETGNQKITLVNGELKVVLEQDQCFPKDPGLGTPAMVYLKTRTETVSATFYCVDDNGDVEGHYLNQKQLVWLQSQSDFINETVDNWYDLAR